MPISSGGCESSEVTYQTQVCARSRATTAPTTARAECRPSLWHASRQDPSTHDHSGNCSGTRSAEAPTQAVSTEAEVPPESFGTVESKRARATSPATDAPVPQGRTSLRPVGPPFSIFRTEAFHGFAGPVGDNSPAIGETCWYFARGRTPSGSQQERLSQAHHGCVDGHRRAGRRRSHRPRRPHRARRR